MYATLLGPLELTIEDIIATPSAAKQRTALALLLVNANRIVTTDSLIAEIWPDQPPASALTTLQTYVLQIRRVVDRAALERDARLTRPVRPARELLRTAPGGYCFAIGPHELDLRRYEALDRQARDAYQRGEFPLACRLLKQALDVWSGAPMIDVQRGPALDIECLRLTEARLSTVELNIEVQLRLGHHHHVLAELAELTARHKLHENFHTQYMLTLYRAGRRGAALEVYRGLRTSLITELGLEPRRGTRALHAEILREDPALDFAG